MCIRIDTRISLVRLKIYMSLVLTDMFLLGLQAACCHTLAVSSDMFLVPVCFGSSSSALVNLLCLVCCFMNFRACAVSQILVW